MTILSILRDLLGKWKDTRKAEPPVIQTTWGPVSENARLRAALNMREDLGKRRQVEQLLADQLFGGALEKGIVECQKRYPEGYPELEGR